MRPPIVLNFAQIAGENCHGPFDTNIRQIHLKLLLIPLRPTSVKNSPAVICLTLDENMLISKFIKIECERDGVSSRFRIIRNNGLIHILRTSVAPYWD